MDNGRSLLGVGHWLTSHPETIIMQPTSLCPLACTYCYLPQRHLKRDILHRAGDLRYVQEFLVGLERCKATPDFFSYCQGAHAGDRYFEHGTFTATETEHCRTSAQASVLALADLVEGKKTG